MKFHFLQIQINHLFFLISKRYTFDKVIVEMKKNKTTLKKVASEQKVKFETSDSLTRNKLEKRTGRINESPIPPTKSAGDTSMLMNGAIGPNNETALRGFLSQNQDESQIQGTQSQLLNTSSDLYNAQKNIQSFQPVDTFKNPLRPTNLRVRKEFKLMPNKNAEILSLARMQKGVNNVGMHKKMRSSSNLRRVLPITDASVQETSQMKMLDTTGNLSWHAQFDDNQIYKLEQSFENIDQESYFRREMTRWREQDIKGKRPTMYRKEVVGVNAGITTVVKLSNLEQVQHYSDGWKCLTCRKKLMKVRIYFSETASLITGNSLFEGFIILIIGLNCITLATFDSTKEETQAEKNIEITFQVLYTIEMCLRILSLGFVYNPGSYLRSYWNQLDFICVVTGFMGMIGGGESSLSGIRAFRVLRPLRTVNQIQALKTVVQSVMGAVLLLQHTILVLMFFMLIFAIGGLNLFMGLLLQRCIHLDTGESLLDDEGEEIVCGNQACPTGYYCGKKTLNPNNDVTNFDNIFWALFNVFQCITLEGWSEIMVMYQQAYTPLVFFFFVSLVFIGAFFFLNLTLAVINSSYSEAQARIKSQKEQLRQEQIQIRSIHKEKDDTDQEVTNDGRHQTILGVQEFFVAKRAAKQMLAFSRAYQDSQALAAQEADKQKDKDETHQKEVDKENENRRLRTQERQKSKRNADNVNSINDENAIQPKTPDNFLESDMAKMLILSQQNQKSQRQSLNGIDEVTNQSPDRQVNVIEEADPLSEEGDELEKDVMIFFDKVKSQTCSARILPLAENDEVNQIQSSIKIQLKKVPVNAFNDPRIDIKRTRGGSVEPSAKNKHLLEQAFSASADLLVQKQHSVSKNLNEEVARGLDFDIVVKHTSPEKEAKSLRSVVENELIVQEQHPFDLSFFDEELSNQPKEIVEPQIIYNQSIDSIELQKIDQQAAPLDKDSLVSSVISSDESDRDKQGYNKSSQINKLPLIMQAISQSKRSSRDHILTRFSESREIGHKLRRMFTADMTKDSLQDLRKSERSFVSDATPITEFKQQIDVMTNLQPDLNSLKMQSTQKLFSSSKQHANTDFAPLKPQVKNIEQPKQQSQKKQYRKLLEKVGECTNKKTEKTSNFIDQNTQKIMINPSVAYKSTSQNEVFERRFISNETEILRKKNNFIALDKDDSLPASAYESKIDEKLYTSSYEPYQLKTTYSHKEVDEIDWEEEEDEDALTLAEQPYETVMSYGCFKDYLNHLNVKFRARRSDIIISSTMSVTLTPIESLVVPTHFALISQADLIKYVMLRNEFRAMNISSNKLDQTQKYLMHMNQNFGAQAYSQFSVYDGTAQSISESAQSDNCDDLSEQGSVMNENDADDDGFFSQERIFKIPQTLLKEPLEPNEVTRMSVRDKKLYNLQKGKYEVFAKMIAKQAIHPKFVKFNYEEAQQLVEGTYYTEEDEVTAHGAGLGRTVYGSKELDNLVMAGAIQSFTTAALIESNVENISDPRQSALDSVPRNIKHAFNLPSDMQGLEIDFHEVRTLDSQFKRRTLQWSGQDVLDCSLNMDKSKWVVAKLNLVRVWPQGFYNPIKKARNLLKLFIRTAVFDNAMTLSVLVNTIGMAMESYDMDTQLAENLVYLNNLFTWIFIVELVMKLLAMGFKKYVSEKFNLLDGAVVLISIIEIMMQSLGGGGGAGNLQAFRTVRVFRTFRVLRVTRILRSLKSMAMIIGVIQRAFMDFVWITLLMFVFIFIYTLLGRQIFQGQYDFGTDELLPRENFESFAIAFITVFQVLTMENWQTVMYSSMRAAKGSAIFKSICAFYYISWIFIGNFILLNLFLAILIDSFGEADAQVEDDVAEERTEEEAQKFRKKVIEQEKIKRQKILGANNSLQKSQQSKTVSANKSNISSQNSQKSNQSNIAKKKKTKSKASFTGKNDKMNQYVEAVEDMDNDDVRKLLIHQGVVKAKKGEINEKEIGPDIHAQNSLYLFNKEKCFRSNVYYIQKHRYFDRFIMLLIALSSTKLALESYIVHYEEEHQLVTISEDLDYYFNILFIVEMLLKILALGFAMDDGSYLRDSWNRLDFFIVMTSIIDMMLTNTDIPALKVLRMLRMIRPLRVISHNAELRMIVAAMFESVGSIINVSFVVMIIWLMFAIYGMNTYMGMFFYCSEDRYNLNTEWVCEDAGGSWLKWKANFDDIGQSMLTLFIVSSLEGWPEIMHQAIDITKKDNGPKYENNVGQMIFFVVFILIGSFFFLNFFIGVLFLKYEQAQKREEAGFNKQQLYWLELQKLIVEAQTPHELRYKPNQGFRLKVYKIITSDPFDFTIMGLIVLNMLQMAIDHEGASPSIVMFLKLSNYFFTVVFLLEVIIKLYVYRWAFFKTSWNKFDFFVVASSLIDLALEFSLPTPEGGNEKSQSGIIKVGPQLARVLRVLRVSRVLRLAGKYKGLQSLLKTIQMSVSSLINVFILLMLIFFIMAVLGTTLFHRVVDGDVISDWKNFTNFHQSFSLLFSISTGEDWNRIMFDCMDTGKGGTSLAPLFFLSFILLVTHIMLNLFVLVIIQQFSKYYIEDDNPLARFEEDFEDFKIAWEYDTARYHCTRVQMKHVGSFIQRLPKRIQKKLDLEEDAREMDVQRVILKMGIQVDNGFIYFNEMLYRVMRAQFGRVKQNKIMVLNELITQFRILELTQAAKHSSSKGQGLNELIFFETRSNATTVNPFLTRMFFKISFSGWRKHTKNVIKRHQWNKEVEVQRQLYKTLGKTFEEPTYPSEVTPKLPIMIETEQYESMSCSSAEEEKPSSTHRTNEQIQAMNDNNLSQVYSSIKSIHQIASMRRLKSRLRFMDMHMLFSNLEQQQPTSETKRRQRVIKQVLKQTDHPELMLSQKEWSLYVMQRKINRLEKLRTKRLTQQQPIRSPTRKLKIEVDSLTKKIGLQTPVLSGRPSPTQLAQQQKKMFATVQSI